MTEEWKPKPKWKRKQHMEAQNEPKPDEQPQMKRKAASPQEGSQEPQEAGEGVTVTETTQEPPQPPQQAPIAEQLRASIHRLHHVVFNFVSTAGAANAGALAHQLRTDTSLALAGISALTILLIEKGVFTADEHQVKLQGEVYKLLHKVQTSVDQIASSEPNESPAA